MTSILQSLNTVAASKRSSLSPVQHRRNKLIAKIHEQINAAKARQSGERYAVKHLRRIRNKEIKANITNERTSVESEIEQLQEELDGVARHKKWVDWVGMFQKQIANHKKFTPEQKKSFLEGMLTGVIVRLLDTKTHQLTINFQLPIVNDSMEYQNKGKKSGPYVVHEGARSLTVEQVRSEGAKKKMCRTSPN